MKKFVIGVGGALFKDGKLLVLKRNHDKKFMPGMWEIPGGKIEFQENPETALKREFIEETGLEIGVGKPYEVWSYVQDAENFYIEIDYLVHCSNSSQVKISTNEHSEFKWIGQTEEVQTTREMRSSLEKAWKTL